MRTITSLSGGLLGVLMFLGGAGRASGRATTQPTQTFTSSQYGYSVDFPADWKRVPDADVKRGEDVVHKSPAARNVIWEAVYQAPGGANSFTYPYVILQVVPYQGRQPRDAELEDLVKPMTGNNFKKMTPSTGNQAVDQALANTSVGTAQYDSANRCIYQTIDTDVPGVAKFKGLTVGHFGRNAMVSVMYYDRAQAMEKVRPTFDRIVSSFQYDSASAYDPSKGSMFGSVLGGAANGAVIGGLVAVLCAGALALFRRRKSATA